MQKIKNKQKQKTAILALLSISLVVLMTFGVLAQETTSASGGGSVSETSLVSIKLYPESQVTDDGTATYKVVVKDLHRNFKILCVKNCPEDKVYNYKLYFQSREKGTTGSFEEGIFSLVEGQSKSVELKVNTKNLGTSSFSVSVQGIDENMQRIAYGKITFNPDNVEVPIPMPVIRNSFFNGQGFALNEDESRGLMTDVKLLRKDDSLSGKIRIGQENFKVDGTVFGNQVKFEIFSINKEEEVGTFIGEIEKFDGFSLLRGELIDFQGSSWSLTAMSKHKRIILEEETFASTKRIAIESVAINEVLSVEQTSSETSSASGAVESVISKEISVRPIEIRRKKFLNFIPNPWGKRIVSVEIVKGDNVVTESITENTGEVIEGYSISVGSLEDEANIEFSVKQAI